MRSAHIEKSSRSIEIWRRSLDVSSQFAIRRLHSSQVKGPVTRPLDACLIATAAPAVPAERRPAAAPVGAAYRARRRPAASGAPGVCWRRGTGVLDDRTRLAVPAGQDRQHQAGGEEDRGQDRGGAGEHIGRPPARQKSAGRADAEPAAFRLLQQHDADHGKDDHEMNDDDDGLHASTCCCAFNPRRAAARGVI